MLRVCELKGCSVSKQGPLKLAALPVRLRPAAMKVVRGRGRAVKVDDARVRRVGRARKAGLVRGERATSRMEGEGDREVVMPFAKAARELVRAVRELVHGRAMKVEPVRGSAVKVDDARARRVGRAMRWGSSAMEVDARS
jgi:hypothetical protein